MLFFNSLCLVLLCWTTLSAQNLGMETIAPISSAKANLATRKQQLLIPRVTLAAVADGTTPINAPTRGLLVYNLNKHLVGGAGVGLYCWEGSQWVKLIAGTDRNWTIGAKETAVQTTVGESKAMGAYALAMGYKSIAYSYGETVVGSYNTTYVPISANTWKGLDRVFVVGNGNSDTTRSNALTVYKNGIININDAYELPNQDGETGQVLMTDGRGKASWQVINGNNLLQSFTPQNTADRRGEIGQMTWDEQYIYVKTTKGWKRTTLTIF